MAKILVIEDEELVRENLVEMLEAEDFETLSAVNGRIGLDIAFSELPDLILCDIMMPEMDGYSVVARLRDNPKTTTIPLIFLTAKAGKADIRQGMDLGADDYLTKPFTRAELLSAIMSRLEKQAAMYKYLLNKPKIDTFSPEIKVIKDCLHKALDQEEFREFNVYYQPILDIKSGKIYAAESLLRWQSPELGNISTAELIPLAESTGLILPLGEWVLQTACRQTKKWDEAGYSDLEITVNISAHQFLQPDFSEKINQFIIETKLSPNRLALEINETAIMQNVNQAIAVMSELQNMGVKISLDDFGTGNSSLIYLKKLPVNTLKIDRYFIHDVDKDSQKSAITTALIQMARNLNFQVVAKGVETEGELDFLRQNNCDAIQGFIFSYPLPISDFEELLLNQNTLPV
jgi:EAL domain-containing protein (putative c-di-GMP-specific phosphodiesterase class I)/ActR/RegA family two-component response regulator